MLQTSIRLLIEAAISESKSDGILNPRRAMKIYYMSREYEFAQICSRYLAVYLRLHLKICTLQTRYKKCSVQIDLLFYVFTLYLTISLTSKSMLWKKPSDLKASKFVLIA